MNDMQNYFICIFLFVILKHRCHPILYSSQCCCWPPPNRIIIFNKTITCSLLSKSYSISK